MATTTIHTSTTTEQPSAPSEVIARPQFTASPYLQPTQIHRLQNEPSDLQLSSLSETMPISSIVPQPSTDNEASRTSSPRRVFDVAPSNVTGRARKVLIAILIISANLVQFISNLTTIAAGLKIAPTLGIDPSEPSKSTWIAASYPLTQGTFVLIAGRLGSVYGHKTVLLWGGAWFVLMSLANGFCNNYIAFTAVRALTGIGGALIMPNSISMLNITVPPGRMRNLSVAFFAASAPIGGWLGALLAAVFTPWNWIFWALAVLGAIVMILLLFLLPSESPVDSGGIDYIGAALGVSGLVLFNFVWNQAPSVGWQTPYEIGLLLTSVVIFALFIIWENRFANEPIMPLGIFKAPSFSALIVVVLLSYMSFSVSLWYMLAWQQILRSWTLWDIALGWIPFGIGATASAGLAAWLIPRLAAQWIVAIGALTAGLSNLLLATMPEKQTYWAQTFPAIVIGSFCPDLVYTAAQIIASNSVNRRQQGVAASLIGTLNLYGNSLGLGFAGTIETEVNPNEVRGSPLPGFRASLYFGAAVALAAVILDALLVRMPKDEREGWADENDHDPADAAEVVLSSSVARQRRLEAVMPRAS